MTGIPQPGSRARGNLWMMRTLTSPAWRDRRVRLAVIAFAVAYLAVYFAMKIGHAHIDLEVYRFAVDAWLNGGDPYGRLPETAVDLELPYIYPPFALLPAIPFTVLPWFASYILLFVLSIACIAGTLYLIARRVWPEGERIGALLIAVGGVPLALTLEPVRETFSFGQINLLLMGMVAIDCLARRNWLPRGMLIGLAAAIKLTPAVFILYFLVRKDYRAAIVAAATGAAATAIGFAIDYKGSIEYWFHGFAGAARISGSTYRANQTIHGTVARFGMEKPWVTMVIGIALLALLAVVVLAMRRSDPVVALLVCAGFAVLAAPTSWSHHWVWIAPALVVMLVHGVSALGHRTRHARALLAACGVTWLLFILAPFHRVPGNDDWAVGEPDIELTWSPVQHIIGNSYVIIGIAWIIGCAVVATAGRRPPAAPDAELATLGR